MLTTTQLKTMLELQGSMNAKVDPNWLKLDWNFLRAASQECAEAIDHHGWKWWKKQEPNMPQLQMELVDIWHFFLSHILRQEEGHVYNSSIRIVAANALRVDFNGVSTDMAAQSLLTNLDLMKAMCACNRVSISLFMVVLEQAGMATNELYKQYVGKNVLNMFRQDNGYKAGTYIKVWNMKEDNEHLIEILDSLDVESESYASDVYLALEQIYPG